MEGPLARWYREHGRHDLPWRDTRDRWAVLVSEVMLHQTQVPRVVAVWPAFMARFPDPASTAAAGPAAVIQAWGRLGYPRRARRLWETATRITEGGWPDDLSSLPGIGRYTAHAIAAQVDDVDVPAIEVNVRRVVERVRGERLSERAAEDASVQIGRPLLGRDRLLALMDVGATLCRPRNPDCSSCPLRRRCIARGPLPHEATRPKQARFAGSFRERRGAVMARLRVGPTAATELDAAALESLLADGLAEAVDGIARLPSS